MTNIKNMLPTMFALARERSDLSRIQLAGMLADIFLNKDVCLSLREEEIVNELIDQLMANGTPQIRAQLLEKFTDISLMPRRIAATFAQDKIEIAYPILVASTTLTDADLIQVVENQGRDYILAVASRTQISEAVADALVITGDTHVMQLVAENLGARLSSTAVTIVADAARYTAELRAPIMRRPEMNADAVMRLYWWVEQDLRRYALKRFGIASGQIDHALSATITSLLGDHTYENASDSLMQQVADWMEEHHALTIQVLPQILRMGHFRLFNMLLARLFGMQLSLVDTIVSETGGRGLASICRAIGVDKAGFVSIFLLSRGHRPGDHIVHPRELSNALAIFDRLSPAIAKDLLHSWNVNPDYFRNHHNEEEQEERAFY